MVSIFTATCVRTWKKTFRRPVVLVFSLIQPLMWMLFFGFLFHRYSLEGVEGHPAYLDFLLPGVCVMTVLFGASQSGVGLIRDLQDGMLARMLGTPAPAAAMLAGKIAADVTRLIGQASIVGLLGVALGARLHPRLGPMLLAGLMLGLFGSAYASLSCWLALRTRSQETMGVFIQAVNMPILFTSTALVPSRHMPGWLAGLAEANPVSLVANEMRGALLLGEAGGKLLIPLCLGSAAFLIFMAAVGETRMLRSDPNSRRP